MDLKNCQSCHCDECGTAECDNSDGQCLCHANVVGEKCDRCEQDHFGFNSCSGCRPCDCAEASEGSQCDDNTGQCRCRYGTTGRKCERCSAGFWNYSQSGCQFCNCNTEFSLGASCNPHTGQCECLPGVIGDKCETCPYRWVLIPDTGCEECTSCTNNLLDVTDGLSQMIGPVAEEFQAAALSYFTHQKLASLDQIASGLMENVQLLQFHSLSLGPSPINMVKENLFLFKHGTDVFFEGSASANADLISYAQSAIEMERALKEVVQNARDVVDEVFLLSESLEGGNGPHNEKSLDEAHNILQEIQDIEFGQQQNQIDDELMVATDLYTNMTANALPIKNNHALIADLTMRLQDFIARVIDLNRFAEKCFPHSFVLLRWPQLI